MKDLNTSYPTAYVDGDYKSCFYVLSWLYLSCICSYCEYMKISTILENQIALLYKRVSVSKACRVL